MNFNEYTSIYFGRNNCFFIGCVLSNDEYSARRRTNRWTVSRTNRDTSEFHPKKLRGGDDEELNATEAKEVTVTLSVQGAKDGSPMQIPVTAKVANDTQTQDLELCTHFARRRKCVIR